MRCVCCWVAAIFILLNVAGAFEHDPPATIQYNGPVVIRGPLCQDVFSPTPVQAKPHFCAV